MQRLALILFTTFLGIHLTVAKYDKKNSSKTITPSVFTKEHRKFQNESLHTHNVLRARHCVPPLVLDEGINLRAQAFATYLAKKDAGLNHSTDPRGLYGENLYSITRKRPITDLTGEKVVRAWYAEINSYDFKVPGYSKGIGHFSQIVWKSTKRFGTGYAFAKEGRKIYVVAQYGPPGNYGFAYRENVLGAKC